MVYITAVRLSGDGNHNQHITNVQWQDPNTGESNSSTRAQMVDWINNGGDARVRDDRGNEVRVGVVDGDPSYIRTYADQTWTDNLLALRRF